jgi:hypothetical protein
MDIDLQMESVLDRRVADAIRRRVRTVRRQFAARGEWRVTAWPSHTGGEWDVGVRDRSGWDSFTDAIDGLPASSNYDCASTCTLSDSPGNRGRIVMIPRRSFASHSRTAASAAGLVAARLRRLPHV